MIARFTYGLAAVAGALCSAQFPAFYQQYLQRLGGRLDQAASDVARLVEDATRAGQTLEAYIQALMDSGGEAARQAALRELERVANAGHLASAYERLADALPWQRPMVFAETFDPAIAQDTLAAFRPAFQLTPDSLAYGAAGLLLALCLCKVAEIATRRLRHPRRERATS